MTAVKMTVLIVDDDVFSRMMLMHLIASCGEFDIVEAEDGLDAWQQLENGLRPAILFCDVRMPRLSGIQLLQRIKDKDAPRLRNMLFVLVSTASEQETQAMASGASAYIVKPFKADSVRRDVRMMLDLVRRQRQDVRGASAAER
jgi:two-component system chemotaxis response regulator CheY